MGSGVYQEVRFLDAVISILGRTKGRDKICRLIQYFFKFLNHHLKDKARGIEDGKTIYKDNIRVSALLTKSMGSTRKVLRFGMEFPLLLEANALLFEHFYRKGLKRSSSNRCRHKCR